MRNLFLSLALICPACAPAQDYWPATGLGFDQLKSVALARCDDSLNELIGCYRAVGGALGADSELTVTVSGVQEGEALVKAFGSLKIVRRSADDSMSSVYRFWQASIAQRNRDVETLRALFRDARAPRIDFGAVADFIRTMTPQEKQPALAARGINEYFAVVFDPHTQLSTRRALADSMNGTNQSYVGIGISVHRLGTRYLITAVDANGPAFAQGIQANDFLTRVDGQPTAGLSLDQLVAAVRGKEHTTVAVTLMRDGQRLERIVPRRALTREVVESRLIESDRRAYGHVRIRDFMDERACDKTAASLLRLRGQGAQGWILDLRGNTGGLISIAVCVAGLFVGSGERVAYRIDSETRHRRDYTSVSDRVTSSALVVLVDGLSASGAELLAGALQDDRRGWIVGERTFGKGSTQSVRAFRIPGTTGLIRNETTGLFFLASGRTTQLQGITPDFVVPAGPGASEEQRFTPRERDAYVAPIAYDQAQWMQPRPEELRKVVACVERSGHAQARFSAPGTRADYQTLYALDVLDCQ
jgi:carboxyl-terminal processing protease